MSIEEALKTIQPLRGEVTPIRTVQETNPPEEFGDAYVAEVNVKAASKVVKVLDAKYPRNPSLPLSHLRRFARRDALPPHLRAKIEANGSHEKGSIKTIFVVIAPPLPDSEELLELLAPFAPTTYNAGPSSPTSDTSTPTPSSSNIDLVTTTIPLQPPFNAQQAEKWTKTMWPVTFNPAAPRATVAPPPQILTRAHQSIQPRAGYYLSLAQKVAEEAEQSGRGRGVGAVIVDPAIEAELEEHAKEYGHSNTDRWMDAVLCVGGDVRFARSEGGKPSQTDLHPGVAPNPACATFNSDVEGGPDLHALMRAVELISWRRREDPEHQAEMAAFPNPLEVVHKDPQLVSQLSPLESYFLNEVRSPLSSESARPSTPHQQEPSPLSQKKRKAEDPNPESISAPLESTQVPSSTHDPRSPDQPSTPTAPLPAPPPSTVATLADPTIPHPPTEPAETAPSASSRIRTRSQGGYLCTDLDIYISHEPCLCCSMGLLLSRFRAVIFPRSGRMKSGGLASEPVITPVPAEEEEEEISRVAGTENDRLYYGLNWRKELNWRALGFEFVEDNDEGQQAVKVSADEDEVVFHA